MRATTATAPGPAAAPARPALCSRPLRARVTGRVSSEAARELSGLAVSPSRSGVLWAHNDSGDGPRLLAFTRSGRPVADVTLDGVQAVDWEDLSRGPRGTLLVGDIGDNAAARKSIVVLRVPEPSASGAAAVDARYELRYPDGARDAEALLYDRRAGAIVIVSKSFSGRAGVYVATRPAPGSVTTLRRRGSIALGAGEAVTAGDVSGDGRTIALRTYGSVFAWRRSPGESVAGALGRRPCTARVSLLAEGQGEALALERDGGAFLTVPEGRRPALRRYAERRRA